MILGNGDVDLCHVAEVVAEGGDGKYLHILVIDANGVINDVGSLLLGVRACGVEMNDLTGLERIALCGGA